MKSKLLQFLDQAVHTEIPNPTKNILQKNELSLLDEKLLEEVSGGTGICDGMYVHYWKDLA